MKPKPKCKLCGDEHIETDSTVKGCGKNNGYFTCGEIADGYDNSRDDMRMFCKSCQQKQEKK